MTSRRNMLISASALIGFSLAAPAPTWSADGPVPVVATFSVLGDMVKRIGGDRVAVTTLVGADGDTHVYQPTPADARAVSQAEVLVFNGLEFEGWLDRLVDASSFGGIRVVATDGIQPIRLEDDDEHHDDHGEDDDHGHKDDHAAKDDHDHGHKDDHAAKDDHGDGDHHGHHHGVFDPHAWHDLAKAVVYVDNITAALARTDPANASTYYGNRATYVAEIEALDAEIREKIAGLPEDRRTVVTPHDAFGYYAEAYGLRFIAPQGLSTESEPSAGGVAALIRQIREEEITAVFVESLTDPRLIRQIADETGASIGGTVYSDALSGPDGPASTYLDMMRHNSGKFAEALSR
ncbi:MAG: metal ABC transporter substrate-binding protein [Alphaproteobacteria bacterium]|nr:metal ABC transporter substrate-binding protein [Alphaproteobacteria bacterium]